MLFLKSYNRAMQKDLVLISFEVKDECLGF